MTHAVDVIVMGMGPGGEDVAGRLAEAGLDVVGIEKQLLGGECPYWGCVPTKMMVRAADLIAEARRIPGVAGDVEVRPDWAPVANRIRAEATDDWDDKAAVERFEDKGGMFVRGAARFTGPRTVEADGTTFEARRAIVVATGTRALLPEIDGLTDTPLWTNREAVETETVPRSIVIIGGGAIGVELGQVLRRFGAEVTIVEIYDRLLAKEDPEAGELLGRVFADEGIGVITKAEARRVTHDDDGFRVELAGGEMISAERLLVATGRTTALRELGVAAAGLDPDARFLEPDGRMRVAEGIWAVGDVTGKGAFTHVAMYQSRIATADILRREVDEADYSALPRVTFSDPEIGAVGLTEEQARDRGIDVAVGISQVPSSARGWIHKTGNEGFIKLIADRTAGSLVGAVSAGPRGGEVLSMLSLAVHERTSIHRLREMIYAYPTFHRGIEDALRELP